MKQKQQDCQHKFSALGFSVFKTSDTMVEAVAAIHCEKCGMFRTKILMFRRELVNSEYKDSYE